MNQTLHWRHKCHFSLYPLNDLDRLKYQTHLMPARGVYINIPPSGFISVMLQRQAEINLCALLTVRPGGRSGPAFNVIVRCESSFFSVAMPSQRKQMARSECGDNTIYQARRSGPDDDHNCWATRSEVWRQRTEHPAGRGMTIRALEKERTKLCICTQGKLAMWYHTSKHELIFFQSLPGLVTIVNHLCTCKYVKQPEL